MTTSVPIVGNSFGKCDLIRRSPQHGSIHRFELLGVMGMLRYRHRQLRASSEISSAHRHSSFVDNYGYDNNKPAEFNKIGTFRNQFGGQSDVSLCASFSSLSAHSSKLRSLNSCQITLQGANVAVLKYKQARTLNRTHWSMTENILTPLLLATHKVYVFVHGKLDGDSWQYHAYLDQVSKRGIRYQFELQDLHLAARQCSMAATELLMQLNYRESVNSLRKKFEKIEGITFDATRPFLQDRQSRVHELIATPLHDRRQHRTSSPVATVRFDQR
mmetsp:Transcript_2326/g.9988  ORF Transcript_2326/g.9988 Transcript_2326/m.9988 type:complete len:273 (+) Transcript_2326:2221-3039(+)